MLIALTLTTGRVAHRVGVYLFDTQRMEKCTGRDGFPTLIFFVFQKEIPEDILKMKSFNMKILKAPFGQSNTVYPMACYCLYLKRQNHLYFRQITPYLFKTGKWS